MKKSLQGSPSELLEISLVQGVDVNGPAFSGGLHRPFPYFPLCSTGISASSATRDSASSLCWSGDSMEIRPPGSGP